MTVEKELILVENRKKEIAEFYKQIFSDTKLKEKIVEKAKTIANEEDLKKLIQQDFINAQSLVKTVDKRDGVF